MQDGLQEIRKLITHEVSSPREEIEAVKTDPKAEVNSMKSEFKANIDAVKLGLWEESGKTRERLGKIDERFEDVNEQLETLTTSANVTQEVVLWTCDHMDNRFGRVEARMDHAIADLKVAHSDISALRHDLQMEEESRGFSDVILLTNQQETS